jgi:gamma-glutamyl:cysteine ligase YbdK (ATP-grasp superfamily)
MGQQVDKSEFSREDRTRYRAKVRRCLDVFARMLRESKFEAERPMTGLEIEFNLTDESGDPAMKNAEALEAIADPAFQTELGQFNIEINVPPRRLGEEGLEGFESDIRKSLNDGEERASKIGAHMLMVGILPTVRTGHMAADSISANPRSTTR